MLSENKTINGNDIKIYKYIRNSNPNNNSNSQFLNNIKNNSSFLKESNIIINKDYSIKDGTSREESKSKISSNQKTKSLKRKKTKKKNNSIKSKKKDKEKTLKLLKNEKIKIPIGKKVSITNNKKLNINNIEEIINSLPKKNNILERLDTNGNVINKENKKNFHITFLDDIPTNKNKLIEIIPIQSFKKLNIIEKIPNEKFISYYTNCCQIL